MTLRLLSFKEIYFLASDWQVSYWSGVVSGILMLMLFAYAIRKYFFAYNGWLPMKTWFKGHVILGSVLSVLLIYHTNFLSVRSINGKFAFWSLAAVVISGFFGRYIMKHLYRSKYWTDAFNYWHVAHVPVIYMSAVFVIIHIIAIHMY